MRVKKTECVNGHDLTLPDARGSDGKCAECHRIRGRKYWENRPRPDKHQRRGTRLKSAYGIDAEFYEYLFEQQKGRCCICGNPETRMRNGQLLALSVDHDHVTGKIRGLLCNYCNRGLGLFFDDPDRLSRAIRYLGGES